MVEGILLENFCPSSPNSIDQARQIIITHRGASLKQFIFVPQKTPLLFLPTKWENPNTTKSQYFHFIFNPKAAVQPKAKIVHCLGSVQYLLNFMQLLLDLFSSTMEQQPLLISTMHSNGFVKSRFMWSCCYIPQKNLNTIKERSEHICGRAWSTKQHSRASWG